MQEPPHVHIPKSSGGVANSKLQTPSMEVQKLLQVQDAAPPADGAAGADSPSNEVIRISCTQVNTEVKQWSNCKVSIKDSFKRIAASSLHLEGKSSQ